MLQYINFNSEMETKDHTKNVASPKNHTMKGYFLLLIVALFTFSSCSKSIYNCWRVYNNENINLDAYSNKENVPLNKKVALMVCNDPSIDKHDLKNLELEGYIKKTLESKGYTFTQNNDSANIIIFYEYGVSDPKVYTYQRIVPVWGQTGIASSRTVVRTTPILGKPYLETTHTPSYGQIGANVVTETKTTYISWINISALDADYYRETSEDKMIWLTEIKRESNSDNLRYIFPYMMVAASEYIEQNRANVITVNVPSNPIDGRVLKLKGTLATVAFDQSNKGRRKIKATIYEDVYRGKELFIRVGTPVKMDIKRGKHLELSNFSTTSVYGNNVLLKGRYELKSSGGNVKRTGMLLTLCTGFYIWPVTLPIWLFGKYPKPPEYLYFEIE